MKNVGGDPLPEMVGQIDSTVRPGQPFSVTFPPGVIPPSDAIAGRYFQVRCSSAVGIERASDWSIFLRRPLFVCGRQQREHEDRWQLYLPNGTEEVAGRLQADAAGDSNKADAGHTWLAQRLQGENLNLDGPFGNGFSLQPGPHNLLLLVDVRHGPAWFWQLLPLCEQALDRGGRVTILMRADNDETTAGLVPSLPIQVEVGAAANKKQWLEQIHDTVGWADQVCAGIAPADYGELLRIVRDARFRVDRNFAQILVRTDLLCGVGACMVCVIPKAGGGFTRACVQGPVFDLTEISI